MTQKCPTSTPADPASQEPSEARPQGCACCGGAREPDPTDDFMRMLHRMAEIGMELTERVRERARAADTDRAAPEAARADDAAVDQAEADEPDEPVLTAKERAARDPAILDFHRATRASRLCMVLALKFHTDRLAFEKLSAAEFAKTEEQRRTRRKKQIARVVKQAIEREGYERARQDDEDVDFHSMFARERELAERLDEEDIERDLDHCPRGELIGRLCRDLDLSADWSRWLDHHWAQEEARLQPAGSPYTHRPEDEPEDRYELGQTDPDDIVLADRQASQGRYHPPEADGKPVEGSDVAAGTRPPKPPDG